MNASNIGMIAMDQGPKSLREGAAATAAAAEEVVVVASVTNLRLS